MKVFEGPWEASRYKCNKIVMYAFFFTWFKFFRWTLLKILRLYTQKSQIILSIFSNIFIYTFHVQKIRKLSLNKLLQDLTCKIIFDSLPHDFQDQNLRKMVGHAEIINRFYYLDAPGGAFYIFTTNPMHKSWLHHKTWTSIILNLEAYVLLIL